MQREGISLPDEPPYGIILDETTEKGNDEKSRQQRSRHVAVLTYWEYAPRVNMTAALLDGLF
jgi:hypothetical protein